MTPQSQLKEALFQAQPWQEDGHAVFDIAHSRLWYQSEEQAREFLERRNMEFNRITFLDPETELLAEHSAALDLAAPFTLVDLGCGDATQAAALIPKLTRIKAYAAVDLNAHFLRRATERIRALGIPAQALRQEFEHLQLPPGPKVVLLLGNTVGNFETDIIGSIAQQLQKGDLLVVGSCAPTEIPLGEHIPGPWISRIPEYLGIPLEHVRLFMKWRGRHEDVFVLQEDTVIAHNGRTLALKRGDEIIAAMYYALSEKELKRRMAQHLEVLHQWSRDAAIVTVGRK